MNNLFRSDRIGKFDTYRDVFTTKKELATLTKQVLWLVIKNLVSGFINIHKIWQI